MGQANEKREQPGDKRPPAAPAAPAATPPAAAVAAPAAALNTTPAPSAAAAVTPTEPAAAAAAVALVRSAQSEPAAAAAAPAAGASTPDSAPARSPSVPTLPMLKSPLKSPLKLPQSAMKKTKRMSAILGREVEDVKTYYSLGRELGRGQFGITFECTDKSTGERLACKAISKMKLKTDHCKDDARREVAILHHLVGHPYVVSFRGAYEDDVNLYLVMELCSGGELFNRIIEMGLYSERKAAEMFSVMVTFIAHCHHMGVIHRDLKPENFLLAADDGPDADLLKATDFGLSLFFKEGQVLKERVGSAYYIAPEVLEHKYGHECDIWSAGVILYIMLSGCPPFCGEHTEEIFQMIKTAEPEYDEGPWESVSENAKDLLRRLLCRDPKARITPEQALAHPWLAGKAPDHPINNEVLVRMRNFSALQKFKQIGVMLLVQHLPHEEVDGLHALFKDMDEDGSGQITLEELAHGLERHGAHLAKAEVEELMREMDVSGDGTIDYTEFLAATVHLSKIEREENLLAAFRDFDADGSGDVTPEEVMAALTQLGVKCDPEELKKMIEEADTNHDGKIEYSEFLHVMAPALLGHEHDEDVSMKRRMKLSGLC